MEKTPDVLPEIEWLDVKGASGYTIMPMDLKTAPEDAGETIRTLVAGAGFTVLGENGAWWQVQYGDTTGWLQHSYCMVNLPDVIPSIIYDNTNTYASRFVTSGYDIPGITGEALYQGVAYNERLGRDEFLMPVLYATAKKIFFAQKAALADGNSLKIYEAFRPYETQMSVVGAVQALANENETVMAGLNTPPWEIGWFIATSVSNHQFGYAIDLSLVKVTGWHLESVGEADYPRITAYDEYEMPCPIHELSNAAVTFTAPVSANNDTAWREATLAPTMNDNAILLQKYCTDAGLTPLASEWWHFNDLAARETVQGQPTTINGKYIVTECFSRA